MATKFSAKVLTSFDCLYERFPYFMFFVYVLLKVGEAQFENSDVTYFCEPIRIQQQHGNEM